MALDGRVGKKMQQILEETKPEAAYFIAKEGKRTGILVINMEHVSEIPKYAEPWFINFDATVDFFPAMTPEDLVKGRVDEVAGKWK
jgi:hypothetical protein